MSVLLGIGTFILVLVSILMVLAILAQRTKSDGGVGAALGGGMAEAAFGGDSGNVLTRATTFMSVTFFVLSLGLYLGHIYNHHKAEAEEAGAMPTNPELLGPALPSTNVEPGTEAPAAPTTSLDPATGPAEPAANP